MTKTYRLQEGRLIECAPLEAQMIVYIAPDEKEIGYLTKELMLDEHTVRSSLDEDELGRVEMQPTHLAAIIKRPKRYDHKDNFVFKASSIGLFLFAEKLIVIVDDDYTWSDRFFIKMNAVRDLFLKIIYHSLVHFEEHLRVIRKVSDELGLSNKPATNNDLLNMFKIERSLVYYEDAISSNNWVLEKLKNNAVGLGFTPEDNALLEDLIIEGKQCYQQSDSYYDVLSSMMDARASIINNNLNTSIKTLTVLSLCIMMPNLVVGFFSMNVPLPIAQEGTMTSFWVVVGLALLSIVGVLLIGRYKKL